MRTAINIGFFDLIIFLGVFQGLFLSLFFIRHRSQNNHANLFQGLLLLFLSLVIFEELLNNTGYIVHLLGISDFSEPLNFTFGPLVFLYFFYVIHPKQKGKRTWAHFIPAVFWLMYMVFTFIQPAEVKYNSYLSTKHPDWPFLDVTMTISDDLLGIRNYVNQLTLIHFSLYLVAVVNLLLQQFREQHQSWWRPSNDLLRRLRDGLLHYLVIIAIYLGTKLYFGMESDVGGYLIASYISLMIFISSYQALQVSDYFKQPQSFLEFPSAKYRKSSLDEQDKKRILSKITASMEDEKYFMQNLASLSGLAKTIHETTHHVSQVINEKHGKSFFELLASYRIEESKRILHQAGSQQLTIEELAERVGYNSKSAFNNAFKRLTKQTPSEYRKAICIS